MLSDDGPARLILERVPSWPGPTVHCIEPPNASIFNSSIYRVPVRGLMSFRGSDPSWRSYLLSRVRDYQSKSRAEEDPFNRYASIFIAYNTLYSLYGEMLFPEADLSRKDFELAVGASELVSAPRTLIEHLQPELGLYLELIPVFREEYYSESRTRIPISVALKDAVARGEDFRAVQMLLRWLYKVRCNLFHGEKDYSDSQQRRMLDLSATLLQRIVDTMIGEYSNRAGVA